MTGDYQPLGYAYSYSTSGTFVMWTADSTAPKWAPDCSLGLRSHAWLDVTTFQDSERKYQCGMCGATPDGKTGPAGAATLGIIYAPATPIAPAAAPEMPGEDEPRRLSW